jgi:hypothetical protein
MGKSKSNNKSMSPIARQFSAQKKKSVAAIVLIILMVLLWIRVLSRKDQQHSTAMGMGVMNTVQKVDSHVNVDYVDLPVLKGRNDVLLHDFFRVTDWQKFIRDGKNGIGLEEVTVKSKQGSEEMLRRLAGNIKLEAIILGSEPKVFMNDQILGVGSKFAVTEGQEKYECEIKMIEEDRMVIKVKEAEIMLKLSQASQTSR